ncbi:MAG: cytochrome b [Caulobacteraceae bacterium]
MTRAAEFSSAGRAVRRYDQVSIILHWLIAAMVVVQLCLGWYMNEVLPDHSAAQASVRAVHISWGLTILILVLIRIAWRLTHWPPPLPSAMPLWERIFARFTHVLFYLLLLVLPLTGWSIVSLTGHPIHFWGLPWPRLPGVGLIFGSPPTKAVRHALAHTHVFILIWIVVVTLALHVAGALWLQFRGPRVLWRMTWMKP